MEGGGSRTGDDFAFRLRRWTALRPLSAAPGLYNLADIGNRASFQAVDVQVTSAVVTNIDADAVSVVWGKDVEQIGDGLFSAPSFGKSGQMQHFVVEDDAPVAGLGDGVTAAEIR